MQLGTCVLCGNVVVCLQRCCYLCCAGARVLFDPWLVGDLQFFEQGWLYTGKKRSYGGSSGIKVDLQSIADDTDVILITQVRMLLLRCCLSE